jgi:hypothetical protein
MVLFISESPKHFRIVSRGEQTIFNGGKEGMMTVSTIEHISPDALSGGDVTVMRKVSEGRFS